VTILDKNRFEINPNNYFRLERPDRHEIRIIDGKHRQVLRVRYINESTFWVEGIFFLPGNGILTATGDELGLGGNSFRGGCDRAIGVGGVIYSFK
jgi:hypothetical protein